MRFKKIVRLFQKRNVCVTGLRGDGKDLLFGNVIHRRKKIYISNLDYGGDYRIPLRIKDLDIKNNYNNFITSKVNRYEYPYPKKADIYISDVGVYLPSQYCNQLNRDYEGLISFQALSRQIGECNVHINVQNLNRAWDKLREQSDIYIRCRKCFYFLGFVLQFITIYDKYESCLSRLNPCRVHIPLFGDKNAKMQAKLYLDNFYNQHGKVKNHILFYKNKSKHNTLYFGHLLDEVEFDNLLTENATLKSKLKEELENVKKTS